MKERERKRKRKRKRKREKQKRERLILCGCVVRVHAVPRRRGRNKSMYVRFCNNSENANAERLDK